MLRNSLARYISSHSSRTVCSLKPVFNAKKFPTTFLTPTIHFQTTPIINNQPAPQEKIVTENNIKKEENNNKANEEKQYSGLKMFSVTTGIGVAMGIFGGMVGLGGGVIAIPLLVKILNLSQHRAHATTLAAITSTGLVGASVYYIYGNGAVDLFAASTVATTAMIMVPLGIKFGKARSSEQLKFYAGLFTFVSALIVALKEVYERYYKESEPQPAVAPENEFAEIHRLPNETQWEMIQRRAYSKDTPLFFGSGLATGFVSGLLGVGGGLVLLPLLSAFTTMPQQLVFGTVLLSMVPITLTGTLTHLSLGTIVVRAIPGLFIGSSIGAIIGGRISIHLSQSQQRAVVVIILSLLGFRQMFF